MFTEKFCFLSLLGRYNRIFLLIYALPTKEKKKKRTENNLISKLSGHSNVCLAFQTEQLEVGFPNPNKCFFFKKKKKIYFLLQITHLFVDQINVE